MQGNLHIHFLKFLEKTILVRYRCGRNNIHGLLDGIQLLSNFSLLLHPSVVLPIHFGDLAEVARPCRWDDVYFFRVAHGPLKVTFPMGKFSGKPSYHKRIEAIHARIVELGSHGTQYGQILVLRFPEVVVALVLLAHVTQRIEGTSLVKLVEGNQVCKVEHVDFLQLRGRPILRRHYVERKIRMLDDLRIGLSDAGSF